MKRTIIFKDQKEYNDEIMALFNEGYEISKTISKEKVFRHIVEIEKSK